jgi:hypothetical protein
MDIRKPIKIIFWKSIMKNDCYVENKSLQSFLPKYSANHFPLIFNVQLFIEQHMGQNTSNQKQENKSLLVDDGMIFSRDSKKVTLEDFAILKLVGKGNFAKVFQVRKKDTDSIYAMKILSKAGLKKANQLDHIKTERVILGKTLFTKF